MASQYRVPSTQLAWVIALLLAGSLPMLSANATEIRVVQAAKLMIYAPVFGAIARASKGRGEPAFKLKTVVGVAGVAAEVLQGKADIGLSGAETAIYSRHAGTKETIKIIGVLSNKDGQFLVSRRTADDSQFSWDQLRGRTILSWRRSNTPGYMFQAALTNNGIDPKSDVRLLTNHVSPRNYHRVWRSGGADYAPFYEPAASWYERTGYGRIVASVGMALGSSVYTVVVTRTSLIKKDPERLKHVIAALQRALHWIKTAKPEVIAHAIKPFLFRGELEDIKRAILRYRSIKFWNTDLRVSKDAIDRLQSILVATGAMRKTSRVAYNDIVEPSFAEAAHREFKPLTSK